MMPLTVIDHQAPVPPPSYPRGQARRSSALHIDALSSSLGEKRVMKCPLNGLKASTLHTFLSYNTPIWRKKQTSSQN
jgi:hypothetical protein